MIPAESIILSDGLSLESEIRLLKKYIEIDSNTPDYSIIFANKSSFHLNLISSTDESNQLVDLSVSDIFKNGFIKFNSDGSFSLMSTSGTSIIMLVDVTVGTAQAVDIFMKATLFKMYPDDTKASIPSTIRNMVFSTPKYQHVQDRVVSGETLSDQIYAAPLQSHSMYNDSTIIATTLERETFNGEYISPNYGLFVKAECAKDLDASTPTTVDADIRTIILTGRSY